MLTKTPLQQIQYRTVLAKRISQQQPVLIKASVYYTGRRVKVNLAMRIKLLSEPLEISRQGNQSQEEKSGATLTSYDHASPHGCVDNDSAISIQRPPDPK